MLEVYLSDGIRRLREQLPRFHNGPPWTSNLCKLPDVITLVRRQVKFVARLNADTCAAGAAAWTPAANSTEGIMNPRAGRHDKKSPGWLVRARQRSSSSRNQRACHRSQQIHAALNRSLALVDS